MCRTTHVRPVERRMPARMAETRSGASRGQATCCRARLRGRRKHTEDGVDAVVDESPELRPQAQCQQVEELDGREEDARCFSLHVACDNGMDEAGGRDGCGRNGEGRGGQNTYHHVDCFAGEW